MVVLPDEIAAQLPPDRRSHMVQTGDERMHVMEWGPGPSDVVAPSTRADAAPSARDAAPSARTIVLVHGNPTWGFLWRNVVASVRQRDANLRLVVPDLIGLGLSSKPELDAHSIEHHSEWLGSMLDQIVPGPFVLVAQDWGGPIGLHAASARPSRLRGIVLGNTAVGPPAPRFKPTLFHRLSQLPFASDVLFRRLGFPLGLLHLSQGDRSSIRGHVARAYRWPLRRRADRAAPLALARMVPDSHEHRSIPALQVSERVFATAQVPIAIVWGERDPILGRVINHLGRTRPDAVVLRTQAGHFLQEEVPELLANAILDVAGRADWSAESMSSSSSPLPGGANRDARAGSDGSS